MKYLVTAIQINPDIDDGKPVSVLCYEGPTLAVAVSRAADAATAYAGELASKGNGKNRMLSVTLTFER